MTLRGAGCVAVAALVGLSGGALRAQQRAVIQTETRVVLMEAIVTGKNGAYVNDLNEKEFHVFQDNKEQDIKSFSLEGASKAAEPRSLVLFFDETGMKAQEQILSHQAASRFIDAETGLNRRMAVVSYDGSLRVRQSFTDNAGRLKDALPVTASNLSTEEKSTSDQVRVVNAPVNSAAADLGVRNMIRSLRDLARSLSVLPGRKIVVLFSGGVGSSSDQRSAVREAIEECNRSDVAIYPADVRDIGVQTDQGTTQTRATDIRPQQGIARPSMAGLPQPRGDTDIIGEVQNSAAGSQQVIFELAKETGGFVIRNSNDLLGGLHSIATEQDEYYVLSFSPPESKMGICHALRVKVDRKGTLVRARSSYCTTKPMDPLAGANTGKEFENQAISPGIGNLTASIELSYFYVSAGVARVNLAMETAPSVPIFEKQQGKLQADLNLLGTASTPDGAVGARFSDVLKLDFKDVESSRRIPLHYQKEFRIAPGTYSFTLVFGYGSANFGRLEVPLVVDPIRAGEPAMSSLVLSNEIHPATDLALGVEAGLIGDGAPLITEGMRVVPSGSNRFNKSERVFFYFEVYEPSVAPQVVRIRVFDHRTGEPKWDSGLLRMSGAHQGGAIPITTLSPGVYQIEAIIGKPGEKQLIRTADFEIK